MTRASKSVAFLVAVMAPAAVGCGGGTASGDAPGAGSGAPGTGGSSGLGASGGSSGIAGNAAGSGTGGVLAGMGGSGALGGAAATGGSGAGGSGAAGSAGTSAGAAGSAGDGAAGAGGSDAGTAGSGGNAGVAGGGSGAGGGAGDAGGGGSSGCDAGHASCSGSCVDVMTDDAHCGACNSPCTGGRTCVAGACQCTAGNCTALPAFPGADGAAGTVTGGRGGDVYHVTLLDTDSSDMRPGTLRYGLSNLTGPRTIVFDVSGVFFLGRTAVTGWDANGNGWDTASRLNLPASVTIAGQTAPGPVIVMGGTIKVGGTNIILRNVTFAPGYGCRSFDEPSKPPVSGDFPDSYTYDALDISGQKVMIDHVTTVYATDETVSMNELANEVTVQYALIAQGQNYPQADAEASSIKYTGHALGSLFQAGSNAKISVHHNLYAHLKGRLPRVGTESGALTVAGVGAYNDFRNNVFYNWLGTAGTGASGQASQNNFIGNFYLAGNGGDDASGNESTAISTSGGGTSIFNGSDSSLTKVYQSGNLKDTNRDGDASDGASLSSSDFGSSSIQSNAFTQTPYAGVTDSAQAAFDRVLSYAGSRYWQRAALDTRIVAETRAGTGKIVAWADDPFNSSSQDGTEWRALVATPMTSRPSGFDTDGDGMPDTWESAHGTNPALADNNGDLDADGYTNLEEYLNELAAWPAPGQLAFAVEGTARYAESESFGVMPSGGTRVAKTAHWQPSRFDVVRVLAGTAVVDAPGQVARAVEIAGSAVLAVRNGWLDVGDQVSIGAHGSLELTGGELRAGSLAKAHGATFRFRGGLLATRSVRFDLVVDGGVVAPGPGVGVLEISGDSQALERRAPSRPRRREARRRPRVGPRRARWRSRGRRAERDPGPRKRVDDPHGDERRVGSLHERAAWVSRRRVRRSRHPAFPSRALDGAAVREREQRRAFAKSRTALNASRDESKRERALARIPSPGRLSGTRGRARGTRRLTSQISY